MPVESQIRDFIRSRGYITIDQLIQISSFINKQSFKCTEMDIIIEWLDKILIKYMQKCSLLILGDYSSSISTQIKDIMPLKLKRYIPNISTIDSYKFLDSKASKNPKYPFIILAYRYFSRLPIKQYKKIRGSWNEIIINQNPMDNTLKYDHLGLVNKLNIQLLNEHVNAVDGSVVEESVSSVSNMHNISNLVKNYGIASLIIDDGYNYRSINRKSKHYNTSLQALKNDKYVPILSEVGNSTLISYVNFGIMEQIASEYNLDTSFEFHNFLEITRPNILLT